MSITSAKTGSTSLSLALENNFMEPIASTLVGAGGVSTVTFNDIPQTYKHLQIRMSALTNGSFSSAVLNFNSDYSLSYIWHQVYGNGASTFATSSGTNQGAVATNQMGNSTYPGVAITDILDYSNTNKNKTIRTLTGIDANNAITGYIILRSGLWINTSAVTSITLTSTSSTLFNQYSRFSLYGIKG
jgi:hypothetical protein